MAGEIFERSEQRIMNVERAGLDDWLRAGAFAEGSMPLVHLSPLYGAPGSGRDDPQTIHYSLSGGMSYCRLAGERNNAGSGSPETSGTEGAWTPSVSRRTPICASSS